MTIKFNCPNCDAVIGFADKHSGKRARCISCGQHFIIPSESDAKPEKVKPLEDAGEPVPGFYRGALVDSWRLLLRPANARGLVFVAAAVTLKFFTGHTDYSFTMGKFRVQAPTGLVITLTAWGCLFWYYMEIIRSTAIDIEELPDVHMGDLFGFIWNVVKSLFTFAVTLIIVLLPSIAYLVSTKRQDFVSHALALIGLFVFPMAILTVSISGEFGLLFRIDYMLKPIAKAFRPYLIVVALFVVAWELQLRTIEYGDLLGSNKWIVGLHLLANLAVQMLDLVAIRSIGLFVRHYNCYFPW
ncbi:MAG: hypothetical protein P8Z79_12525 [Sedimentisphaerales bacterium]|jgi:hypothetical protein